MGRGRGAHRTRRGFRGSVQVTVRLSADTKPGDTFKIYNTWVYVDKDYRVFDAQGTEYAVEDPRLMTDKTSQAGVGPFSLPQSDPFTPWAKRHDFQYSSAAYQAANPRSRADDELGRGFLLASRNWWRRKAAILFYNLAVRLGDQVWDDSSTRWK